MIEESGIYFHYASCWQLGIFKCNYFYNYYIIIQMMKKNEIVMKINITKEYFNNLK